MQVTINGETTPLENIETVTALIEHLELEGKIAVEINREILPRSLFTDHRLKEGDVIEIVHAIGGG